MVKKYSIIISKSVTKSIKKIPLPWRTRIIKAIDVLEIDPLYGEKLYGKLEGKRKIRVWPYRIVYEVDVVKIMIAIIEVSHRQGAY